ncbi:MAG: orotidine-5'-phosphate decarboxylase [Pyrinomonadaceae bacterium]|nr:orotidine-5'-phosphate decarboxylase [Pyrinomonadaceae bacterium]
MTQASAAIDTTTQAKDRIIVALDVPDAAAARGIVAELGDSVGAYKVGLQLFTAEGPSFVRELVESGAKIFLDLKFHDIPNTVAMAAVEAARLGVWMFNVHASGGSEMMRQTATEVRKACESEAIAVPKIIAVTVLTSSDGNALSETGIETPVEDQVVRLAKLARESGLDGVVASANEAAAIRSAVADPNFVIVTPGIRPVDATIDDQKRVMTFGRAVAAGSDFAVIGRPITQAADMRAAVAAIVAEAGNKN